MDNAPQAKTTSSPIAAHSEHDTQIPNDDRDRLIAAMDLGHSHAHMLVIREVIWSRIAGAVIGLMFGIPVAWVAVIVGRNFRDVPSALIFAAMAGIPLAGSVWLLGQLLNRSCYYIALDDRRFYRRWGPRKLVSFPLHELGPFFKRGGAVRVEHQPTGRKITVIKDAYAPERLETLAVRLNAWRATPEQGRFFLMTEIDVREAREARAVANRQILSALYTACLYPLLIVLSTQLDFAHPLRIAFWAFITFCALWALGDGIVKRFSAPRRKA